MSRSTDEDVRDYVAKKMPTRVKKALADAKWDLYYGPGGGGGMGWVKASKIVEEWWDSHMSDDLVIDDAGNVSTKHDWNRFLRQSFDEREKEALQEAIDQGVGDDAEDEWEADEAKERYARAEAESYVAGSEETATLYDERDVRRLVLGKDWP